MPTPAYKERHGLPVRSPVRSPGWLGVSWDPMNHALTHIQHGGSRAFNQVLGRGEDFVLLPALLSPRPPAGPASPARAERGQLERSFTTTTTTTTTTTSTTPDHSDQPGQSFRRGRSCSEPLAAAAMLAAAAGAARPAVAVTGGEASHPALRESSTVLAGPALAWPGGAPSPLVSSAAAAAATVAATPVWRRRVASDVLVKRRASEARAKPAPAARAQPKPAARCSGTPTVFYSPLY